MKNYLFLLSLLLLMVSCKENQKEAKNTIISSTINKTNEKTANNPYQDSESQKAAYKALKKKTPLTDDQLLATLPEHINGTKIIGEYARQASYHLASGAYGSAQSPYDFSIEDGSGSKAIVRNFFDSLKFRNQGPEGTEYVYTDRDGYHTIAFLQPKIKRNQISFIYNNRFRISIQGPDSAETLWSYIDFENLKKLDQYK